MVADDVHRVAAAVWAHTLSQLPSACSDVTLVNHVSRADASDGSRSTALAPRWSQLTNLRQLNLQYDSKAVFPVELLSTETNLESLQLSGNSRDDGVHLVGSLQALPSSITRLQLSRCKASSANIGIILQDLTLLKHLKELDLTDSAVMLSGTASSPEGLPMLTKLTLNSTLAFGSVRDDILPLTTL